MVSTVPDRRGGCRLSLPRAAPPDSRKTI